MSMNALQTAAVNSLVASLLSVRKITATFEEKQIADVSTVSGYVIPATSAVIVLKGENGEPLPDFPAIEVRKTGKFALPTIRSYREANVPNTLQPYPAGMTAFDAALYADSHVRKQNGAWLRRSPQAATAAITAAVAAPVTAAPAGISGETGKDTAKLTAEIQGKRSK